MPGSRRKIMINRAPVLTLWAAVVAEQLGFDRDEALTMGKALSGLTAHSKGVRLGIYQPSPETVNQTRKALEHGEAIQLELMGWSIAAVRTEDGLRALRQGKAIMPQSVSRYLAGKFGDDLDEVREAMTALAHSLPAADLGRQAFGLYEAFRPKVKTGTAGWGTEGELDLARLVALGADGQPGGGA
ncbi:hypothetical protein FZ983_27570 [Azospirillum sp. B21]|uniref:hypothetical protein n=1 Tax=Azospirillum sp. B21 TaxID=2607496 RepID=UPI0011EFB8C0|nr:hypothetical protein [Azospirillum sp. B21]KAA0574661.1 hypothetical protein FZ983_27570 [Azospirillum sp. B21]